MLAGALVLAGCGGPFALPAVPADGDYDCRHFQTRGQAQRAYEAAGGPARDPHRLDADRDGRACDSLPR